MSCISWSTFEFRMAEQIQLNKPGLAIQLFTLLYTILFLAVETATSEPEELSNANNNNFIIQPKDNALNYSKTIANADLSELNWKTLDELSSEQEEALERYKAPYGIAKRYVYYLAGYDHEDRPIWIVEGGKWNLMEGVRKGQTREMEIYFMQMARTMIKSIPARSTPENPVTQAVFVLDFADLDFAQLRHIPTLTYGLGIASKTFHLIEKHVGEAMLINANFATQTLLNIVKPFWGGIFSKVTVYGNNKEVWMPKLLKSFPKNAVPGWYGGDKDFKPVKIYG